MYFGATQDWSEGEDTAWKRLASLDPQDVCRRARAAYDEPSGRYVLPFFNNGLLISPKERLIACDTSGGGFLLERLQHYARLAALCYLIRATDVPLSGSLVNPENQGDALLFARGTHVLPLDKIAQTFGNDVGAFGRKGAVLGGVAAGCGDASVRLLPFPRLPVVLVLWRNDDEFPARANLLLDATCTVHLPPDVLWATAMLAILAMLLPG